jgi:hypothetical protein
MLQFLMTLSDEEVDLLIRSVHRWCALNHLRSTAQTEDVQWPSRSSSCRPRISPCRSRTTCHFGWRNSTVATS